MPYTPDIDHVVRVIGKERFAACLSLPVADWGLTPDEIAAIRRGPHGKRAVYPVDGEYMGFETSEWVVACECGITFTHMLLSNAQREHDDHAGTAVSHIHTADMLDG